jgi:2-polyprenyl-3-methyl-5-hydroxy-6-metoxy-1,4-benzoquinol methylase
MNYDENALQAVRERRLIIDQYDSWIVEEIKPFLGQRVLEIGCGLGNLLWHFTGCELVVGIENSSETVMEAKKILSDYENVSIHEYSITDPSVLMLQEKQFDTVVSLNVFEHIENDDIAMYHSAQLLQPHGYFILVVPAHDWLYGTMDSSIGHYRRYNKKLVKDKAMKAGFRIVHQRYINTLGAFGWFVNGRLFRRSVPPSGQLRAFNKIVPILKTLERVIPPWFGISLITVAQLS